MPYDRDQVIAAVTEYYEFFTRLHLTPKDIRRPPPEGWPEISKDRLSSLNKTDEVIKLLKYLPYVQNDDNYMPIIIFGLSACNDYTGWRFQQDVVEGKDAGYLPSSEEIEGSDWAKLRKPHPHMIALACPQGNFGDYIFCDTEDGECVLWEPLEDERETYSSVGEFVAHYKKEFLDAESIPISKTNIKLLKEDNDMNRGIRRLLKEHGWPSDAFDWKDFIAAARKQVDCFDYVSGWDYEDE